METGTIFKFHNDLDTDQIIASQYLLLPNLDEMKSHTFESLDPDFAKKVKPGDFVVGGENFGCGSSREHAPLCLKTAGVSCVIAETFARIFYRNAINNGMLLIECDTDQIDEGDELFVDVKNRVIKKINDPAFSMPFTLSEKEIKIINEGGLLNYIEKYNSLDI